MNRKIIFTENAPGAIGYYSQAVVSNGLVYTAGQIPLDPKTGEVVSNDFSKQTKQTLNNIESVLKAAGTDLSKSIKLTVFITDLSYYPELNAVFKKQFDGFNPPARSVVEVSALPKDVMIEIDCIATL
ncbi:Rid family detoxifying hydrolase [Candidatus Neomarinimicrobiota bacterium]